MDWKRTSLLSLLLLLCAAVIGPSPALAAPGAVVHEATEDMFLLAADNKTPVIDPAQAAFRDARSAIQGTAQFGTPLCPTALVGVLAQIGLLFGATSCTVTIDGHSNVSLSTGAGTVDGTFSVVVNADNFVDSPEFVVMTGKFSGEIQLDPTVNLKEKKKVLGPAVPLIQLFGGKLAPDRILGLSPELFIQFVLQLPQGTPPAAVGLGQSNFTGVFRLPFVLGKDGKREKPEPLKDAFYLSDDGKLLKVRRDEFALGFATVRLELTFQP